MADRLIVQGKALWQRRAPRSYAHLGTAWQFWRIGENVRARLAAVAYALGARGVIGARHSVHVFDAGQGEFPDIRAILMDRMYERVPGFGPHRGSIVVDVGANVGTFSLYHAGYGARVYAFEPQATPFRRFQRAIALSGLSAVIGAAPLAVADYDGRGSLDTSNPSTTMATLRETALGGAIVVARLDSVLDGLSHVDLLKIDTEGAEDVVLAGARSLLSRTDRVILEYHDADKYTVCQAVLRAAGFTIVAQDVPDGPLALGLIFA